MNFKNKSYLILGFLLIWAQLLFALKLPELKMMVNDNAGILSTGQESELENFLRQTDLSKSAEIALLTVTDLEGLAIEDYSMRVVEKWKLGKQDRDNGILLLVSINDRKVRLEVGYGLEGIITDAKSSYIINQLIIPEFRQGSYYQGIKAGLNAVSGLINESYEISAAELEKYQKSQARKKTSGFPVGLIIFILFLILSRRRRSGGLLTWLFLGSMMGSSGGSHSSGSGGGFGGFSGGGGSFGGGGASGSW